MRVHHRCRTRGVAMLLVLISVMTASVLTIAYVASRDNSAIIGENVCSAASARWTADTGVELSLAILQTEAPWRTSHDGGKLVDDLALGDALLDLDLLDIETNSAPNAKTEHVRITATAQADGVEEISTAVAYVPSSEAADVDLSEFAIFASARMEFLDDAIVTRWPMAALSSLGQPLALGTQATNQGAVGIYNCEAPLDSELFVGPSASNSLVMSNTGADLPMVKMSDGVPMPAPPSANIPAATAGNTAAAWNVTGGSGTTSANTRIAGATFGNTTHTLQGNIELVSNANLNLTNTKLIITGNAKIVVFNDLVMDKAAIELKPTARLIMYVGNQVELRDSYIGDQRATAVRDNSGCAPAINLERIKIFRLPELTSKSDWRLRDNSVVKASVYAPAVKFEVTDQSALYGRVAAHEVWITGQGALFYDPSLNRRNGYTRPQSPVYGVDGKLLPEVKALTSLDPGSLQTLADQLGIELKSVLDKSILFSPTSSSPAPADTTPPTEPHPRPIEVAFRMVSSGSDVKEWEDGAP